MIKKLAVFALAAVMTAAMGLAVTADVVTASAETRAVFDFGDKAFFSVKMYDDEKVLLKLDTAYQHQVEEEYGLDFESFYNFVGTNDTFNATGELFLPGEEGLFVYEISEGGEVIPIEDEKEVEFVSNYNNYSKSRGGEKVSGYLLKTKALGNYGLARN